MTAVRGSAWVDFAPRAPWVAPALVALGAVTAAAAIAAPLLVYTLSLAAFGLPHVLSELRYVDARFHARLGRRLAGSLLLLLGALVAFRVLALDGWVAVEDSRRWQLLVLGGLVAVTLPVLRRLGPAALALGIGSLAGVAFGVVYAAATTLVVLAVLHNVTPVGFLAERLRGAARARAMLVCAVAFVLVPGLIATGLPWSWFAALGWVAPEASLLAVGPLETYYSSFVPAALRQSPGALHLFSAAVYLQCLHYAVVLHVLPRLLDEREEPSTWLPWPQGQRFAFAVAFCGILFFVGFALSFADARAVYGVFAAVHAWIEVPILMLVLAPEAKGAWSPTTHNAASS